MLAVVRHWRVIIAGRANLIGPLSADIAPVATELRDQLAEIERPEARAVAAPRANAAMVVDEIAERFNDSAGHAGEVRGRSVAGKCGSAVRAPRMSPP
jgi:hypothetical protein